MKSAGVMGWPVAHSRSPVIHRFWLEVLGLDGDYGRFAVHPVNLKAAIRALPALGLAGVNITVPHKVMVIPHLDSLDATARTVGAVNTVVVQAGRLHGTNTDVAGFLEPLAGTAPETALVIGAGGAARAVLVALKQLGIRHVTLMNRSQARAGALLAELQVPGTAIAPAASAPSVDLLVNASSLGMAGQPPLELDLAALPAHATVYDIVYTPLETPLLAAARARGLATLDGLAMLIGQAAKAFEHFFGQPPPRDRDPDLRRLLTA